MLPGGAASEKRRKAQARGRAAVRDRRRFQVSPVPTGETRKPEPEASTGTRYPHTLVEPTPGTIVLKDGANNCKIGGDVLVGHLRGAHIVTLTLEERATCPSSCTLWTTCYGNMMNKSDRFRHGPSLEARIRAEIDALMHRHEKVLVRLHVLGDFYSWEYLCLWAELLDQYDGLNVFGFTAWPEDTQIGAGVARLREVYPRRFAVRTSGRGGRWGSFTIDFPTRKAMIGDAVVCPEQRDAMGDLKDRNLHCGSCGLCWKVDKAIVFVEH